jgi:hypothetical protein
MSAAEALKTARNAGIRVGIDGTDLVLEAPSPPPSAVLDALSRNKADIIMLLRSSNDDGTVKDWRAFFDERVRKAELANATTRTQAEQVAYESCVIEWLNRNSVRSTPGLCVWCGGHEKHGASILPFGVTPYGHTWLHGECWKPWYDDRRRLARAALSQSEPRVPKWIPISLQDGTFSAAADWSVDAEITAAEGVRFARYTGKLILRISGFDRSC